MLACVLSLVLLLSAVWFALVCFALLWLLQGSHVMTRGTWTGAEIPGSGAIGGTGVSTVTSSNWATGLTHLFVFDQPERSSYPFKRCLWLGKGIPRAWLIPGERIGAEGLPTRYGGRVSLVIDSVVSDSFRVNITLPQKFRWPELGIKLRLRSPAFLTGRRISAATVGGKPWDGFNATEETLSFLHMIPDAATALQNILVTLS